MSLAVSHASSRSMGRPTKRKSKTSAGARARRFAVRAPVRYRAHAGGRWHSGTTENVSRSGVLLRGDASLTTDTPIDLILDLPVVLPDEPSATVICRGRVVRAESADTEEGVMVAAELSSCRFRRTPPG
jgi:hypothetical protein